MKKEVRTAIEVADLAARSADLPSYTELVDLVLRAQGLMPHTTPARKSWVKKVIDTINRIDKKEP